MRDLPVELVGRVRSDYAMVLHRLAASPPRRPPGRPTCPPSSPTTPAFLPDSALAAAVTAVLDVLRRLDETAPAYKGAWRTS